MLHTKFRGNRSNCSKEDFWRVFTIYGMAGVILVMWLRCREQTFVPTYPRRLHKKFVYGRLSGFREEDVWNCGWQTDGRWTMGILHSITLLTQHFFIRSYLIFKQSIHFENFTSCKRLYFLGLLIFLLKLQYFKDWKKLILQTTL